MAIGQSMAEDENLLHDILEQLEQNPQISIIPLAKALDQPKKRVEDAIEEMVKRNIIVREGSPCCGRWAITDVHI